MKILIAPSAMKGSLSAYDFADAIEEGLNTVGGFQLYKQPIADGGDDTAIVLAKSYNAQFVHCATIDPLGRKISAGYYYSNCGLAIIEMAMASGLKLLAQNEYNALQSSSYGTGLLINHALQNGAKKIILCVGGSATVDAGMGALMALGVKFFDAHSQLNNACGEQIGNVINVDFEAARNKLSMVDFIVLCDVKNTMLGNEGSVKVFAPQKGASISAIKILERNMSLFAGLIYQTTGIDVSKIEGGGAAGSIAASFYAFLGAKLVNGADFVFNKIEFEAKAKNSDLIITGEGYFDKTSLHGKATGEVLKIGTKIDKPVFVLTGQADNSEIFGIGSIYSIMDENTTQDYALKNAYELVVNKAILIGKKLKGGK